MMEKDKGEQDVAQDKRMIRRAVAMHDKQAHGGKKTNLTKLKKGGPTGMDRREYGRNMAKVLNQRSGGK